MTRADLADLELLRRALTACNVVADGEAVDAYGLLSSAVEHYQHGDIDGLRRAVLDAEQAAASEYR